MAKSIVYVRTGADRLASARTAAAEPLREIVRPGSRVLIKINQVGGFDPASGATVHPQLVGLLIRLCREAGAAEVGVAEDVGRDQDTMLVFDRLGTTEVARENGASIVDLRRHPHVKVPVPGGGLLASELEFAEPLLQWDTVVGLTKLKTHHQAGVTGALKNLFGAVTDDEKRRFHRSDMDRAIVDINTVRRADFTVVDAFPAMEGLGPSSGTPVPLNLTLAGADPVAVDAVGAAIMGFPHGWARYLTMAAEKGLGTCDLREIEVRGLTIAATRRRFRSSLDQIAETVAGHVAILDHTSCNGCAGAVATALMLLLRRHGRSPTALDGLRIQIGGEVAPAASDGRLLVVGDCAACDPARECFLPGCPPTISEVMERISRADIGLTLFTKDTLPRETMNRA